jgi:hypothetical protein
MEARSIESYSVQTDEGVSSLDRFAVRDRIRRREVGPETKVARAGSEVGSGKRDSELKRYFDLSSDGASRLAAQLPSGTGAGDVRRADPAEPAVPLTGADWWSPPAVLMTGLAGLVMVPLSGCTGGAIYLLAAVLDSSSPPCFRSCAIRLQRDGVPDDREDWERDARLFQTTDWPSRRLPVLSRGRVTLRGLSSLDNLSRKTTFPGCFVTALRPRLPSGLRRGRRRNTNRSTHFRLARLASRRGLRPIHTRRDGRTAW